MGRAPRAVWTACHVPVAATISPDPVGTVVGRLRPFFQRDAICNMGLCLLVGMLGPRLRGISIDEF